MNNEAQQHWGQTDWDYYDTTKRENRAFWQRLGGYPSLKGLKVLDIGCGVGSLCVEMGLMGARRVVGIDPIERRIAFARNNVRLNFSDLEGKVEFQACDILGLREEDFDLIVSKDTFEHIRNLDQVFPEVRRKLRKNGLFYLGFTPIYNSPYGDHKYARAVIPWGHLIFPESWLLKRANRGRQQKLESLSDLPLNRLSFAEHKRLIYGSQMKVLYFRVNPGGGVVRRLFSLAARIPVLSEYFSVGVYCILQNE